MTNNCFDEVVSWFTNWLNNGDEQCLGTGLPLSCSALHGKQRNDNFTLPTMP